MFGGFLIGVAVTIGLFALAGLGIVLYVLHEVGKACQRASGKPDGWPN